MMALIIRRITTWTPTFFKAIRQPLFMVHPLHLLPGKTFFLEEAFPGVSLNSLRVSVLGVRWPSHPREGSRTAVLSAALASGEGPGSPRAAGGWARSPARLGPRLPAAQTYKSPGEAGPPRPLPVPSDAEANEVPRPLSRASRVRAMAQELYHEEFARAGKKAGLQVWRIEKLELVPVPKSAHGDFYVGDAYIVLHTARACRGFTYRLHFWLGKGSGQPDREAPRAGKGEATVALRFVGLGGGKEPARGWPGDLPRRWRPRRDAPWGPATFSEPALANAGCSEFGGQSSPAALDLCVHFPGLEAGACPLPLPAPNPTPFPARGSAHPGAGQVPLTCRQVRSWFPGLRRDEVKRVWGHSPQLARRCFVCFS